MQWVQQGEYDRIRGGSYPRRGEEPPPSAEFQSAVAHYRERFSTFLERAAGDVQAMGEKLSEWLRGHPAPDGDDDEV
jgi:hypothetical protein